MSYVPKYLSESSSIKYVTVDLQHEGVATKKGLEGITHVGTSSFALKANLSALKTKVDKLDIPVNNYYDQQSYFLFEPKSKPFTKNGEAIHAWISTGIHNDSNNTDLFSVNNSDNNSLILLNKNNRLGVTFNGSYMKQNKLGYAHGKIVNLYIIYEFKNRRVDSPDFTVQNGLFGAIKITKYANISHCKYERYGICFDGESAFSFGNRIDAKM